MNDPNFRRMLDLTKPQDYDSNALFKHYAILKTDRISTKKSFGIKKQNLEAFESSNHRVKELYF